MAALVCIAEALSFPSADQEIGSDGVEAAIKCSWQYFRQPNNCQPERVNYIGRQQSYHGATMGALSVGGHRARKRPYTDLLLKNMHFVSACNPKIDLEAYESLEEYRGRLWEELECKFQELGTGTVVALVVEPVVGAVSYLRSSCEVGHFRGRLFSVCWFRNLSMCTCAKLGFYRLTSAYFSHFHYS
jgi:hypothetical protein